MTHHQTLPIVFFDESWNSESDRFFVCWFLKIMDVGKFVAATTRVHDQIFNFSKFWRDRRLTRLFEEGDIESIYKLAKSAKSFELKFSRITEENSKFFKDFIEILFDGAWIHFDAIVVDRKHPDYEKKELKTMYAMVTKLYFSHRCKESSVFVPDIVGWLEWSEVVHNSGPMAIVPTNSDSSLPLQAVDILTWAVNLWLKKHYKVELTESDKKRIPVLETLEKKIGQPIRPVFTYSKKYFSVWTIDFSRTKKPI